MDQAILTVEGALQEGLAASLTNFVYSNAGEITEFSQYVDTEAETKRYFARMSWGLAGFDLQGSEIGAALDEALLARFDVSLDLQIKAARKPVKLAIFVTREMPCLYALLLKCFSKAWHAEPVLIISNRIDLQGEADRFEIPFVHLEINPENRVAQGDAMLKMLDEHSVDLVILAKYMQIIPPRVVASYQQRMINIHHSLLPAFAGARPYHQARNYGVKYIGATAHYVVDELDEGPIISQGMTQVSHRQTSNELAAKGQGIEAEILTQAVEAHLEHRIIINGRRAIVLDG